MCGLTVSKVVYFRTRVNRAVLPSILYDPYGTSFTGHQGVGSLATSVRVTTDVPDAAVAAYSVFKKGYELTIAAFKFPETISTTPFGDFNERLGIGDTKQTTKNKILLNCKIFP